MKRIGWITAVLAMAVSLLARPVLAVELDIKGKSGLLMDVATGTVLYEKNSHEPLAPASVTKVMTMLLIMEAIDSGKISWEDTVTTSEAAFVEQMNARAKELGMADTHFVNCTGLDDDPGAESHRTSAHDIALMSRELLTGHPNIKKYTTIWMDSIRGGSFGLSNTNKLVRFYPGCTGLKTGFTSGAGYCLSASAERDGMELIAVAMGSETSQKRNDACRGMLDFGFANYAHFTPALTEPAAVPVKLGVSETVSAVLAEPGPLLVKKGEQITTRTELMEEIDAPVEAGQPLGELTVERGGEVLAVLPLVAEGAVEKLTWSDLFARLLGRIAMGS